MVDEKFPKEGDAPKELPLNGPIPDDEVVLLLEPVGAILVTIPALKLEV